MAGPFTPPKLYDTPFPDLFTLVAQRNPQRDLVQIIREYADAPTDAIRINWETFIQHAQNAAADLRARWSQSLKDEDARRKAAQPREPGAPSVVVGLLASNGYECYVNLVGCTLNRWTVLLISPKNSPAAIEHLLRVSNSTLFVVEPNNLSFGRNLEKSIPILSTQLVATLDPPANGPASSPLKPLTSEQVTKEMELPAFYMHTSGSTGHPKIIPWSHSFFLSGARCRARDGDSGIGLPFYSVPPLFHAMGMFAYGMFVPAHANLITFVSSPTPKPPSAASLVAHIPFIKGGIVSLPPSILEDLLSLGEEAVKTVAEGTYMVIFAGAPLKKKTGDALTAAGLNFVTAYGSTEINLGAKLRLRALRDDWEYLEFRDGYDLQFLPVDDQSNLRELVVAPGAEDCPAVLNHESPRGFATNDIWVPHPSVPYLWKHHSRKGDVTVLSNGEKTDNKQIESLLLQDNRIIYVQVFGAGRPLNGVVLQPADAYASSPDFRSQIEPTIQHANSILPKHSRLVPELVIIASPNKPFATTDKGTVKAKETLDKFEQEIEDGYTTLEEGGGTSEWAFEGSVDSEDDVRMFVRTAVASVIGHEVPDDEDLFEHGLDSLLGMRLRSAVLSVVKKAPSAGKPVPRNIVYTFPSINALTTYLLSRAESSESTLGSNAQERVLRSIAKYSADFVTHRPGTKSVSGEVVALTGSTGSLGSSLLGLLLAKGDVSKIYLLNRKGRATQKERQAQGLRERGLDPKLLDENLSKIVYLDVDLSRKDLGLADKDYNELRDNVTHIIHAAWHLNFNLILESYERVHIAGVRHLIDLALSSPQRQTPRLTFLSSIASVGMYHGTSQDPTEGERAGQVLVPEEPINDASVPLGHGYGMGKYVSERVLVNAVKAGLRTTIVRVGQLSGVTTNGAWSTSEHPPIMFRSSLALGMIPDDLPPVRWVPSDIAASAIMKQAFGGAAALEYYHVENAFPTAWKDIAEAVSASSSQPLRLVGLLPWLEHIRKTNPDPEKVPAIRLMDFFLSVAEGGDGTAALGWEESVKIAPELAVGPITAELVKKYVLYQVGKSATV